VSLRRRPEGATSVGDQLRAERRSFRPSSDNVLSPPARGSQCLSGIQPAHCRRLTRSVVSRNHVVRPCLFTPSIRRNSGRRERRGSPVGSATRSHVGHRTLYQDAGERALRRGAVSSKNEATQSGGSYSRSATAPFSPERGTRAFASASQKRSTCVLALPGYRRRKPITVNPRL
jgi:hypothetical protein